MVWTEALVKIKFGAVGLKIQLGGWPHLMSATSLCVKICYKTHRQWLLSLYLVGLACAQ